MAGRENAKLILLRAARLRRDEGHLETKKFRNRENKEIEKFNSKEKRGFENAELILSGKVLIRNKW